MSDLPSVGYAKCGDLHIAYEVLGTGLSDLIVISGSAVPIDSIESEPSLDRFHRRLATFSRVIRFDLRGTGLSDPVSPANPPSLDQWVQDALCVMDAVDSERATVLAVMGGSPLGTLMAVSHSQRVEGLVIVNGWARMARAADYPAGVPQHLLDAARDVGMETDAPDRGYDALSLRAPSVAGNQAFRTWWQRAGNRGASPAMARSIAAVLWQADVRDLLGRVEIPTLILHRADDRFMRVGHGRYLAEHIAGSRYVELPGADDLYWVGDTSAMLGEIEEFVTGSRASRDTERAVATVLFTDIVGSTDRATRLGDQAWRDLLDLHDRTLRRQLARFGGREVNTVGDGFVATFDSPRAAIECAVEMHEAIRPLDLEIRTALHSGEIELRELDVGGIVVHIAARVCGLCQPGDILVTRTVKDLVAGAGMSFADRGEHTLKGVPDAWQLYAVQR